VDGGAVLIQPSGFAFHSNCGFAIDPSDSKPCVTGMHTLIARGLPKTTTHAIKMAFNDAYQRLEKVNNRHPLANYWHSFAGVSGVV